ncbi:hypothetical protein EV701_101249 [Chthoniobacter flavus]|nr:sialidase family protein [Chthoniobacter flavus]TCO95562.1 hypothetical protein EV701_101249 [Chthoniobacter flavus]
MNTFIAFLPRTRGLCLLGALFFSLAGARAAETADRVKVVHVPGAANVMKAERGTDGTIHLLFDANGGPNYVRSTDGGATFSAPLSVVDEAARKPGLEYATWDMAIGQDGRVHVVMGTNAWKLKLPQEQWGMQYATLAAGAKTFTPVRNLNHKPSEGYSLAASGSGAVTASFLSGKVYTMASRDGGENFSPYAEVNPLIDPCKCCTTSTTYGPDGRLALIYREETNNERDIYLVLADRNGQQKRTRISATSWQLQACPMTYFTIRGTPTGFVTAWPTKGQIYFARLDKDGTVLPPGEIPTPGRSGMRTGVVALSAPDGVSLVVWKSQDVLGWQLYDVAGAPLGKPGSVPSRGSGAAAVVLGNGKFAVFP